MFTNHISMVEPSIHWYKHKFSKDLEQLEKSMGPFHEGKLSARVWDTSAYGHSYMDTKDYNYYDPIVKNIDK